MANEIGGARYITQYEELEARLIAAQQEIETERSLTASWIEQCERYKARAETAEAERDDALFRLVAEKNAHRSDNEYLIGERDKLREDLARYKQWYFELHGAKR